MENLEIKDLDSYINKIAFKIKKELNIFQRLFVFWVRDYSLHHFGLGLYIRNKYIYSNKELMSMNIDTDELSKKIFDMLVKSSNKNEKK